MAGDEVVGLQVRAVVFDFDGLLMDTESTNIASWMEEWAAWGVSLDPSAFFVPHGGDVTEHRYHVLAAMVGDAFDVELSRVRRTARRDELNAALRLSAGIESWLTRAAELGLRTAVASSSDTAWVERHLGQVDAVGRFDVIVGCDEVTAHKPAPDVYRLALDRLGVDPAEGVALEDTAHGVDAAHAAGLACIAIPNPQVDPSRLSRAELVLRSAEDSTLEEAIRLSTGRRVDVPRASRDSGG